jgi:hypothetical protein
MDTLETPLQRAKRRTLEAEEQLIARIHLIAVLASKGVDTREAEARLESLKQTLDFFYEVLAHHEAIYATLQHQYR